MLYKIIGIEEPHHLAALKATYHLATHHFKDALRKAIKIYLNYSNKCFHNVFRYLISYIYFITIQIKLVLVQDYYKLLCSFLNLYQISKATKIIHTSIVT